jgi:sugar phosphate isomerase/epimerase
MMPRITLALDNCFASKRWTEPDEWMEIAREVGVFHVEASADNECDPLYSTPDVLNDWIDAVETASARTGVTVSSLYSGHGTYTTLGLAHPDRRVRDHIQRHWLGTMIRSAARLGAGLGFFCHAFSQAVLRSPKRYEQTEADLVERLAQLAALAAELRLSSLSVEQMYSPHQIPWTIAGAEHLLAAVFARAQAPLYLTLDTGHAVGQQHYLRPTRAQVAEYLASVRSDASVPDLWLGLVAHTIDLDADDALDQLMAQIEAHPYLFAQAADGDPYAWLRHLGCYSPIIHLQQTDGSASAHRPFTLRYNAGGIIEPGRLLRALAQAYTNTPAYGMPPPVEDIYLTLEIFSGTAEKPAAILANIRESAAYWRKFIPQDGLTLDRLIEFSAEGAGDAGEPSDS